MLCRMNIYEICMICNLSITIIYFCMQKCIMYVVTTADASVNIFTLNYMKSQQLLQNVGFIIYLILDRKTIRFDLVLIITK